MSVCRRNEVSDVYVYEIDDKPWTFSCCCCSIQSPDPWSLRWWQMILHLLHHHLVGDKVPGYAFRRLWDYRLE